LTVALLGELLKRRLKGLPVWVWALVLAGGLLAASLAGNNQTLTQSASAEPPGSGALAATWQAIGVFIKLSLVVALVFLSLSLLRRWRGGALGASNRQLAVLETIHLSPRQAIHLVRAGKQVLLVGGTDQALTLLAPVEIDLRPESQAETACEPPAALAPATAPATAPAAAPATFASLFTRHFANR
jgi:flagellar biogenesis protein FliO